MSGWRTVTKQFHQAGVFSLHLIHEWFSSLLLRKEVSTTLVFWGKTEDAGGGMHRNKSFKEAYPFHRDFSLNPLQDIPVF